MTEDLKNLETQEKRVIRKEQMQVFCSALNGIITNGKLTNHYEVVRTAKLITSITCDNDFKNRPIIDY